MRRWKWSGARSCSSCVTALSRYLHLTFPPVAFFYFAIIIVAAVRWGFWEATVASVVALGCLDYFFTQPLFSFRISGSADWTALGAFEFAGLVASRLSAQAQSQAEIATQERNNMARLYELSRSILLLDRHEVPGPQIAALVHQALGVESVALYDPATSRADATGEPAAELEEVVRETWLKDENRDTEETETWCRILRLGRKGIGAIALRGGQSESAGGGRGCLHCRGGAGTGPRSGKRNPCRSRAAKRSVAYGGARRAGARLQDAAHHDTGGEFGLAGDRVAWAPGKRSWLRSSMTNRCISTS